jgi:hypothetical protein
VSSEDRDVRSGPHYALEDVVAAFADGRFEMPARVARHLRSCGWDRAFVRECVLDLRLETRHKSVPHRSREGVWLDVYRPTFRGQRMYLKLTAHERDGWFLVLSCCLDGQVH